MKKVLVYGSLNIASILFHDARDSDNFEIACFVSDNDYLGGDEMLGLPWVSYDKIHQLYPSEQYD